jgi:hypothetical protein
MLGIGALVASWTTFGTNKNFADGDSMQWRLSLGIQIVPAVVLALLIMLFPESPRYACLLDSHPGRLVLGLALTIRFSQMAHRPRQV